MNTQATPCLWDDNDEVTRLQDAMAEGHANAEDVIDYMTWVESVEAAS